VGTSKAWENHKLWNEDPVMAPFRTAAESSRSAGYSGPAGRAAAKTISKFIVVDMYAKAVQGMAAEDAVGPCRTGGDLRLRQRQHYFTPVGAAASMFGARVSRSN
jgi:hypothetical protein